MIRPRERREEPLRIASFLPSATEILFALGLGDHVVGVSHECDYPLAATTRPRVTTSIVDPAMMSSAEIDEAVSRALAEGRQTYRIDVDLLRRLQPDLIVTQDLCVVCAVGGTDVRRAAAQLSPEPRVLALTPGSLGDVIEDVQILADAAGAADQGDVLVAELKARLAVIQARTATLDRPRVLCLEWLDPAWIAGHWMPEVVELAGGVDVLAEAGEPSRRATWDEIAAAEPEVAIIMPCGFGVERALSEIAVLESIPQTARISAFREDRVFVVDSSSYYSRPSPRLVDGVELLAAMLHPDRFPQPLAPCDAVRLPWPPNARRSTTIHTVPTEAKISRDLVIPTEANEPQVHVIPHEARDPMGLVILSEAKDP
ncbi:MAG: iron complex transport system substrate-binding protein [Chloroflexota bacterium]|jgi:iron complex transport system substrate-binding protein|nr:iron complex transport system substrate-binding protein [Chloroflexota bacterium]